MDRFIGVQPLLVAAGEDGTCASLEVDLSSNRRANTHGEASTARIACVRARNSDHLSPLGERCSAHSRPTVLWPLRKDRLVARRVRFVAAAAIAAVGSVSPVSCRTNRSSSDAHGNSAAHGCTTIDATAIDTAVMNTNATNPNATASSIREGVSRNSHDAGDANDGGCGK